MDDGGLRVTFNIYNILILWMRLLRAREALNDLLEVTQPVGDQARLLISVSQAQVWFRVTVGRHCPFLDLSLPTCEVDGLCLWP